MLKQITNNWDEPTVENIKYNFDKLKDIPRKVLDLENEPPVTSENINIISPLSPLTAPNGFQMGISLFYETQDTPNGISWLESIGKTYTGVRLQIETSRTSLVTIQKFIISKSTAGTNNVIIDTFTRTSYNNLWGVWTQSNGDANVIQPVPVTSIETSYPKGLSIFYDTQDTVIGKAWLESINQEFIGGARLVVETSKEDQITIQTLHFYQTTPAPTTLIGEYKRSKFGSQTWGDWTKMAADIKSIYAVSIGTNVYNKAKAKVGRYYRYTDGALNRINTVSSSHFIPVVSNQQFMKNVAGHVTFLGEGGEDDFISGVNIQTAPSVVTVPNNRNIKYMVISFNSNSIDDVQLIYLGGGYAAGHYFLNENETVGIANEDVTPERVVYSESYLKLPTPHDDGLEWAGRTHQATHPSVQQFDKEWNGFKYWMAFTPYPKGMLSTENPCIVASNDGVNWIVPDGVTNPLDPAPTNGYNSDTHIFFNDVTGQLEIWYRPVRESSTIEELKRVTSLDGVNWSEPELMVTSTSSNAGNILQYISPSILFENGKYYLWVMQDWFICRMESLDGKTWTNKIEITHKGDIIHSWHPSIQKIGGKYYMLNCDKLTNQGNGGDLYYYESDDGIIWTNKKHITTFSGSDWDLDGRGVYRATMIKETESLKIYYGMYTRMFDASIWTIGMIHGRNIENLRGSFPVVR